MMRVDVFPDDLACWRDLEHPPPLAFADQRVARGEALRTAGVRAEERPRRVALILPYGLARAGIEFDHPRERILSRVLPVGEQGDMPVGQHLTVMLHAPGVVALLPARLARGAVNDHDGREPPETQHDIPIGQRATRIGVRELIPVDQRVQGIALDVQVVLRMPLPDVTVQVVKTRITQQLATADRLREAETEPLHPVGRLHMRR